MVHVNGRVIEDGDERDLTVPPHSLEAEEAVLGGVLKNPARAISQVADVLEPRDFYNVQHQLIWAAMLALEHDGEPIDYTLLGNKLRQQGTYDKAGGMLKLAEINIGVPTSAFVVHYAKIVVTQSTYRRLISLSQGLAEAAWRGAKTPDALMDEMGRRLAKLSVRSTENALVTADESGVEAWNTLEVEEEHFRQWDHSRGEYMAGWRTGLDRLDEILLGLKAGDLIYLAARTGMGKSIMAQQIAMNVANHGGPVVFASLEMSYSKLVHRAITMHTGVLRHELARGNVTHAEKAAIKAYLDKFRQLPLVWDTRSRTVESIRRNAQRWSDDIGQPLALIVVDYVQLLRDQAGPRANRYENVSAASHALKEMAESMQCTVLAPAQVSRQVMNRSSKMPDLSDLRESGDLEQDCDIAVGLDRPNYHDRNSEDKTATLAVLKARDLAAGRGRGTAVPLAWLPKYERYGDLARDNVVPFQRRATILPDDDPPTPTDDPNDLPF